MDRLNQQLVFLNEIEKLKIVYRHNHVINGERQENSAEHSWHICLMVMVLDEYANDPTIDFFKVIKMLLIHDLVEIYAGDTWLYDEEANADKAEREQASAAKLYGRLPTDQQQTFTQLWQEFELGKTPESQFAQAIDALQPLSNHLLTGQFDEKGVQLQKTAVLAKKRHIAAGSQTLWQLAQQIVEQSVKAGLYKEDY